ncbi:hypothetical protein [Microbacterium sp. 77mftsu3.1]|uniref:hypothetical protein n=1 Tax=Microbacterium sp. 77mftsu3.1 TaxID=1761802 RepID=UPI00036A32C0|nr:hypothetical protein [Microbacterium sp. 77mftsu3.1]SDH38789.1 hypothetical protein SAMN04488590_3205 [Microbacterium sp. 77mftsu3.1]
MAANKNDTDVIADQLVAILVPEPPVTPARSAAHGAVVSVLASIPAVRIGTPVAGRSKVDMLAATALEEGVITGEVLILIAEAAIAAAPKSPQAELDAQDARMYRNAQDAIESVHHHFACYTRSSHSLTNQAHHLIELSNGVGDLASFHHSYDENNGTLGWEREDA